MKKQLRFLSAGLGRVLLLVLPAAGAADLPSLPEDSWFPNGQVNAIVRTADTVYLGGAFTALGRLQPYGVPLDRTTGQAVAAFPKVNGTVYGCAPDGSGGWYIGGSFTQVGALTRNRLAHIQSDGMVDPAWDPNADSTVRALAVAGATVYVGGDFTTLGGGTTTRNFLAAIGTNGAVAAWNPNGGGTVYAVAVVDSTVVVGGAFYLIGGTSHNYLAAIGTDGTVAAWDPQPDNTVYALAVAGATVYVGGSFTTFAGGTTTRNRLAAFGTDGILAAWNPNANNTVRALAVAGATVYAGGSFRTLGGTTTRNRLAAIGTDGTVAAWNPNADGTVYAVAVSDAAVYAGGAFMTLGAITRNYLAAIGTDGALRAWDPNANSGVSALAVAGATVYAGGSFTTLGGSTPRNYLAAIGTNGTVAAWDPNPNYPVYALAVAGATVYAGGDFTTLGGSTPRNRLAAIGTDGTVAAWDPNANDAVFALGVSGATVYVGGRFTSLSGGTTTRNYLAAVGTDGTVAAWDPNANEWVRALAVAGETVYAGGSFTTLGGTPRRYLAAIDTNGTLAAWDPSPNDMVWALAVAGATVYAGGDFTTLGGSTPRNRLAAIGTNGTVAAWDPNAGGTVYGLAVASGGAPVYAGGGFTTIGGSPRPRFAQFGTDSLTPTTTTLGSSLNPSTYGVSVTCTATVSPSAASGTVTFKDGATTLGTGTLSGGVATLATSGLAVGGHTLTAEYAGDASYSASTNSPLTQTVNAAPAAGCAVAVLLNNNSTSGNERAPTLKNRFGRSVYLITAAELAAKGFPSGKSPTTIGWNYQTGNGLSGSGPLVVYLENTLDTANNKSTTWATAITGMTIVHNATTTLPSAAGPFDITLSGGAPFTYTGGGLYVAFDMQYPVGTLATATAIWCNAGLANGLIGNQGATAPTALTASSYRPETRLTRFIENDAEVTAVYALGELPRGLVSGQTIQAVISNKGANTLNNLVVTLHVTGVDAFTDTQIIPTLSPCGGQATVTFTAFTSCGLGSDTLVVSVPDDDFAAKNSLSQPLNLTPLNYSYKLPGTTASGGVGYNGNSGALVGKFATTAANAVTDVKLEFSTTSATTYRVAIYGDSGSGTPSTTALYVDAADRTVTVAGPVTLTLPSPVAVGPGNFYVGIQQTATVNANLSYDSESPLRSGAFFEASPNPPTAWSDLAPGSNFKLNIGVILQTAMALSVDTDTTNQTVLTGAAVTWSVAASGTGPLAYQWQRDGTNLVEGAGHFTGVTSATLTNSAVSAADGVAVANGYQCLVSLGGCSTTSTKVSLTVKPAARTPVQNGPWSDPATWGGTLPGAGEDVVIPAGFSVTLDVGTPALKNLTIAGTLSLGTNTLQISGNFTNNGAFNPGTGTVEFTGGSDTVMTATFPGTLTFYNLKLNKDASTNTVTALSKLKATKKLTLTKGKLISASDYGDVLIETDGTLELTSDITIGGDLVIQGDGTLTPAGHKITFDGGIAQNLTLASLTTFDDVTVTTGTTLVETESGDAVMVNGTLLNQGVIRKTQAVTGVESYYFGLAGNSGAGLEIDVTDLSGADPLTAIQVDRVDGNPTNAPGTNTTGIYWVITPTGSNFTASLILPHADWPAPQVCRSTGTSWSAARSGFTADTVTRDGLTSFGELAVFNGGVAVAVSDTLGAIKNRAVTVAASVLTANDTVAAGYTLSLTGVDYTGGHGGAVGLAGGVVTYTPAADYTGSDAFTYTVSDGQGGTAVGTVAVTVSASGTGKAPSPGGIVVVGGTVTLTFRGVPNRTYQVQWSDSVNSGDWHDLGITTAGRTGSMTYEDTPPGGTGSRFYRIVYPVHDN